MNIHYNKIVFSLVFLICSIQLNAQFTFDTIPDSRNRAQNQNGFTIEQPASNQTTQTQAAQSTQLQQTATVTQTTAQKSFDVSRLVFGGSFGLSFSNNYSVVNISPQVGYMLTNNFVAGVGISYNHYSYSRRDIAMNYFGGNIYGRYYLLRYLTFQIQPEIYTVWGRRYGEGFNNRAVPVVLVGAGGTIPIGYRSGLSIMFYYDLIQDDWSPYDEKVFYTIGYAIRF